MPPKRQPPYAVVLHNDDVNGFDFVIEVLRKVFHYDQLKAERLTLQAHETGRSAIWSGSLEVAELKADQVRSCGPGPKDGIPGRPAAPRDHRAAAGLSTPHPQSARCVVNDAKRLSCGGG